MPYFGAGVPNSVAPNITPTWVFTPTPSVTGPSVRFVNTGNAPVYIGQAGVTQWNGLPVYPGNRPFELQNCPNTVFACAGIGSLTVQGTVGATAYTSGTTAITLTAAVPAGLAAGTYIAIGNTANTGGNLQGNLVNTTTASSQLTFAVGLTQEVANGDIVYSGTLRGASLQVWAGVL
jgi:hypothetical protein